MPAVQAQDATALKARHAALREQLANNQFKRPLYLESSGTSSELRGDIYALVGQPYALAGAALQGADHWCDILILHQNVKGCRIASTGAGDMLDVSIGRKVEQPLADTFLFRFLYRVAAVQPDYVEVVLSAGQGPLGTSSYRILLEVVSLDTERSFLHLSYSFSYGMEARLAMQSYLDTMGSRKVGFSIIGSKADGQPVYIGGMRGAVERNTMRYYLAIEAYLGALSAPPQERLGKRLADWFTATERYPLQLHELERGAYLDMKRREVLRQHAPEQTAQ